MTPTSTEAMIMEAILVRLRTLELDPELPVAWPDLPFSKPEDNRYLRVHLLPNATDRMTIDSDGPHRYYGIVQMTLVRDTDGGVLSALQEAGEIASHFPADLKMKYGGIVVRSMKRPDVAQPYPDVKVTSDLLTPVSVEYETYV